MIVPAKRIGNPKAFFAPSPWPHASAGGHSSPAALAVPPAHHSLARRDPGNHALDQVRYGLDHAPARTRRTKTAPLATKGQQYLVLAGVTSQAEKAVGEDTVARGGEGTGRLQGVGKKCFGIPIRMK